MFKYAPGGEGKEFGTLKELFSDMLNKPEPPAEPDWGLVRRACDAVYQGTEAEFLKAEK